jgi:hypothetical protein
VCVCVCVRHRCKSMSHTLSPFAEQSSRKRAQTKPTTPISPTTHRTSNSGKKKLRQRRSRAPAKRAKPSPTTPISPTTHRTSKQQKKSPAKAGQKQLKRNAVARLHIAFSRLSRCQRESYCGYAAGLAHARTEQPKRINTIMGRTRDIIIINSIKIGKTVKSISFRRETINRSGNSAVISIW